MTNPYFIFQRFGCYTTLIVKELLYNENQIFYFYFKKYLWKVQFTNVFQFKNRLPFDLVSGLVYKYMCGRCNSSYYGEKDRHLNFRSGEYIGISPLTFGKVKPSKESAIYDHLVNYNNIPSFDEFTILAYGYHKYILEIKENLLIKSDRPVLNKNTSSAELFLFDNN